MRVKFHTEGAVTEVNVPATLPKDPGIENLIGALLASGRFVGEIDTPSEAGTVNALATRGLVPTAAPRCDICQPPKDVEVRL